MARHARYDEIADWYPTWVGDGDGVIADGVGDLLPPTVHGARVLDVACGHGRASRGLARRGAHVVGVDISAELIASAREREVADSLGIYYYAADVTETDQWWDGVFFDGDPCFPGNEAGLSSWPPGESYFHEGRWISPDHNPAGVRIRVGSSHRTMSTYLNTLVEAGFALERAVEPPAPVPTLLLLRC